MISEVKIQMLLKLIESKAIEVDDIKDVDYKTEVQVRLAE